MLINEQQLEEFKIVTESNDTVILVEHDLTKTNEVD